MEAEYDQIAEEYDATRDAATQGEVQGIASALEGGRTVLDVGMGTGRFAKPISELGFTITGVDVSRKMLLKAREKGLRDAVLGDAYSLPFQSKAFDGAMIIHVLHIVVDWARVMREVGRVTKGNVVTIFRARQTAGLPSLSGPGEGDGNLSMAGGYPVRTRHRMWENEQALKERVPPVRLERVRDEDVRIPVADAIRRLEAKRSMAAQMVPPEVRKAMLDRMIAMSGNQYVTRRVIEDLAVWRADQFDRLSE